MAMDLGFAQFFGRVNHDIVIHGLKRRIDDAGMIRLIRACMNAGVMDGGVAVDRHVGTPHGKPRSPLLLGEVGKARRARGSCFACYAVDGSSPHIAVFDGWSNESSG